jgi:flagellar motor switch protein FliN/FliY
MSDEPTQSDLPAEDAGQAPQADAAATPDTPTAQAPDETPANVAAAANTPAPDAAAPPGETSASAPEANATADEGGDPNTINQADLDALTAKLAQPSGRPAAGAAPATGPSGNAFDQTELDTLTAQMEQVMGKPVPEIAPAGESSGNTFDQAELDALAAQLEAVRAAEVAAAPPAPAPAASADDELAAEMAAAIAAEQKTASIADPTKPAVLGEVHVTVSPDDAAPFTAPELGAAASPAVTSIDLLDDVQLDVKIELGRTGMYIEDVLRLGVGSVVELDKLAGDPVDIYVNDRLIARGEVLVLNENFCVRINDIHSPIPELESNK